MRPLPSSLKRQGLEIDGRFSFPMQNALRFMRFTSEQWQVQLIVELCRPTIETVIHLPQETENPGLYSSSSLIFNLLDLRRIVLQLAVQSCLANAQQARGLQLVTVQFGDGVENALAFQLCHGHDPFLAVSVAVA